MSINKEKIEIDVEKVIGYKPKIKSPDEEKEYEEKLKYLEYLGIIGVLDGGIDECSQNTQKTVDRCEASILVFKGKEIPKDLLERLLKYKEEEEKYSKDNG